MSSKAGIDGARGPGRWALGSWSRRSFGRVEAGFLALLLLALGMRLWELSGRTMHYDEAIHVHFAWRLLNSEGALWGWPWVFGTDYIHAPWAHGPFQFEFTALVLRLFGDSDFTARLGYALFGTALVGLPYFLRDYLGRTGALLAGVMLALSPVLLYFSRFGRNDILMAFWVASLLVLLWRYANEEKRRYLYLASAVLAFMFATKETAYIVVLVLGAMLFLPALPDLVPWALGRIRLSQAAGAAGFFLLLGTLTLPQWVPIAGLAQDALGLTLANAEGVTGGLVGAPHWGGDSVAFPVYRAPWWYHVLAMALMVGGVTWAGAAVARRRSGGGDPASRTLRAAGRTLALGAWVPLAAMVAVFIALFHPLDRLWTVTGAPVMDLVAAGVLAGSAVAALVAARQPWRRASLLVILPALLAAVYAALFTDVVNVDSIVNGVLPNGISVDASANAVPVNYLVAGGLLLGALALSVYLGVLWLGARWLLCAGIFYGIWLTLYTTVFTNLAGAFSGVWQGMGYWIAQQDVARGNQPWYYYFVGLSVYELLPLALGLAGAVYFLRKGDLLGLALTFWAGVTLLAYTVASEKMPWLMVNVTLPFILLAGKYLGELADRVPWREVLRRGYWTLLVLPPLTLAAAVYLVYVYANPEGRFSGPHWALLFSAAMLAMASAFLVRLARPRTGMALVPLGLAALLLGFGALGAVRAAYTYDDSNLEMLVYAQGSKDLRDTYRGLDSQILSVRPTPGAVKVDYDLWYPLQWYARQDTDKDVVRFFTAPDAGNTGDARGCDFLPQEPDTPVVLLTDAHSQRDCDGFSRYEKVGPSRNLLWFYEEAYRRPGENRQAEGFGEELAKDFRYFKSVAASRESWFDALAFLIFRDLEGRWYDSLYYSYMPLP